MPEPRIITYQGLQLKQCGDKKGGKNNSDYDGFYEGHDNQGNQVRYFVKKPDDKVEMLCELLAGRLIQKIKDAQLIDADSADLLICADAVQLHDGSYALIQPAVNFKELYYLTNTGYGDESDRSPWYEILFGKASYSNAIQNHKTFGVSSMLFLSLLVGDQSVHSGNVIWQKKRSVGHNPYRFGRIDWGASFRNYCDPNNKVLNPTEYQGLAAYKNITKNYISYYTAIPGMLQKIGRHAVKFESLLTDKDLSLDALFTEILEEIPQSMIDFFNDADIAQYFGVDTKLVETAFQGKPELLASKLAETMVKRLHELQNFKEHKARFNGIKVKGLRSNGTLLSSLTSLQQGLQAVIEETVDISDLRSLQIESAVLDTLEEQFKTFFICVGGDGQNTCDIKSIPKFLGADKDSNLGQVISNYLKLLKQLKEYSFKKDVTILQMENLTQQLSQFIELSVGCMLSLENWPESQAREITKSFFCLPLKQREKEDRQASFQGKIDSLEQLNDIQREALKILATFDDYPLNIVNFVYNSEAYAQGVVKLQALNQQQPKLKRKIFLLQYPEVVKTLTMEQKLDKKTISDLNKLSEFAEQKLQLNKGANYKNAMHGFFVESFKIRVSAEGTVTQKKQLEQAAHKHFKHRHFSARLLADAGLMISSFFGIGIVIGVTRFLKYGNYFFSTAKTKTEEDFNSKLNNICL